MCWRCDLERLSIEADPGSSKGLYLRQRFVFVSCNDPFIVLGEVLVWSVLVSSLQRESSPVKATGCRLPQEVEETCLSCGNI